MLTEAEAREKWCPHTRVMILGAAERATTHNRIARVDRKGTQTATEASFCIANECMAWRWEGVRFEGKNEITGETQVTDRAGDRWANKGWSHEEIRIGYCGLAGKP